MPQLAGTSNEDSLNLAANLTVGGTSGFVGNETHSGLVTFSGAVTMSGGVTQAGTILTAAGTVTLKSGIVAINLAGTGFATQLPAPVQFTEFKIVNMATPTSGNHTVTIPAGGTIYQGTISGSVLTFTTRGQTAMLLGMNSTQYFSMLPGTMNPVLS